MSTEKIILKVIIADTDLETFNGLKELNERFNTIFLSSEFAVNFILEYEKIDIALISKKISNLNGIIERARKRDTKILMMGKDLKYPIEVKELEEILEKEYAKKKETRKKGSFNLKSIFGKLKYRKNNFIDKKLENKTQKINQNKSDGIKKKICINNLGKISNKIQYTKVENNLKKETILLDHNEVNNSSNNTNKIYQKTSSENVAASSNNISNLIDNQNKFTQQRMKIIKQKVIILTKAKGGVGSTTMSLFLSSVLKDFSTLLIDLNYSEGGGDISYYLGTPKSPNILNFLNGYNGEALENSIIRINNNLDILQSPPTFDQSKKIELQDLYCLTDIAKKKYHLIIFDLPNQLNDLWFGVIDLADLVILISDLTLGSIGRLLKINNRYLYKGLEKLLVFNRYQRQNGFNSLDSHISNFFELNDYIFIEEDEFLRKKVDYSNIDFNNMTKFHDFSDKVLEILAN
jgi:MinD-like ATPase involved in chromosome partitioning or flagellar assembly